MDYIWGGILRACDLMASGNRELIDVVTLSLLIASVSTLLAVIPAIPAAFHISTHDFRGKYFVVSLMNTLLSVPTVVIGLFVYSLLSKRGPFGFLDILFTWEAIVVGQIFLVFPLVLTLVHNALQGLEEDIIPTALSLGASKRQAAFLLLREGRYAVLGAVIAGFGRVIGEVGISMMLGGNIKGATRTMTTAIALETSKGEFAFALALGFVLVGISFLINLILHYFQRWHNA